MNRSIRHFSHPRLERLESRDLLTGVPFGASSQDTAEFLIGDVSVNVVFLESNGAIDPDTEDWNAELAAGVKANIEEGLQWWIDTLGDHSDLHYLNFHVDYTYADNPVETSYEPISRGSQDFTLWIEEFYRDVGVEPSPGFSEEIREFNHQQRVSHGTNWSFTIFVVNAENDPNDRFGNATADNTVFERAFAYPGGQFIVMPHSRPASTVAHELGHMFWAFDEYSGSNTYQSTRGYYRTQNTNAFTGNPDPDSREPSIMASTSQPYVNNQISQSARETIGWKDSDGDGVFDVLDVPHQLDGEFSYDNATRQLSFTGQSTVGTLPNRNTTGTGNDMTINRITGLQYRIDGSPWLDLADYDAYDVEIDVTTPPLPAHAGTIELRTIDDRIGVTSEIVSWEFASAEPEDASRQNPAFALDVNNDGAVSAIDVLNIVQSLNNGTVNEPGESPYLDVTGDGFVSSRDALTVINYINTMSTLVREGQAEPFSPSQYAGGSVIDVTPLADTTLESSPLETPVNGQADEDAFASAQTASETPDAGTASNGTANTGTASTGTADAVSSNVDNDLVTSLVFQSEDMLTEIESEPAPATAAVLAVFSSDRDETGEFWLPEIETHALRFEFGL